MSSIVCLRRSTKAPHASISASSCFINIFRHSIIIHSLDIPKPREHILLYFDCDILTGTFLYISLLWIRSAYSLIQHMQFLSFLFCLTKVLLPYDTGTSISLCAAKRAATLTYRHLIIAAPAPLFLLTAARLSTAILSTNLNLNFFLISIYFYNK